APVGLPMTIEVEAEPPPPWQDGPPACAAVTPEGPAAAGRLTVSSVARSAAGAATAGTVAATASSTSACLAASSICAALGLAPTLASALRLEAETRPLLPVRAAAAGA